MHVPHTWQGHQAGNSGSEGASCTGIQVQAAGEETAGKTGYDSTEIWSGIDGERMFLAWT